MNNWKKEYCKKFGLCESQSRFSKCTCLKEIRFIEKLLIQERSAIIYELINVVTKENLK